MSSVFKDPNLDCEAHVLSLSAYVHTGVALQEPSSLRYCGHAGSYWGSLRGRQGCLEAGAVVCIQETGQQRTRYSSALSHWWYAVLSVVHCALEASVTFLTEEAPG